MIKYFVCQIVVAEKTSHCQRENEFIGDSSFHLTSRISARTENVFDTVYSEINGFTTRGRGVCLSVRYALNQLLYEACTKFDLSSHFDYL